MGTQWEELGTGAWVFDPLGDGALRIIEKREDKYACRIVGESVDLRMYFHDLEEAKAVVKYYACASPTGEKVAFAACSDDAFEGMGAWPTTRGQVDLYLVDKSQMFAFIAYLTGVHGLKVKIKDDKVEVR